MGDLLKKIPSQRVEVYPIKEPGAADGPEPEVPKGISSETSKTSTEKELTLAKATATRPLSPYIVYDDLKPLTSPTPKVPGSLKDVNIIAAPSTPTGIDSEAGKTSESIASTADPKSAAVEVQITRSLSHCTAYEDLKPPSSPSPTPSDRRETSSSSSTLTEVASQFATGNDVAEVKVANVEKDSPQAIISYHSPYPVYDDLKPPTSPSPSSPTISLPSTSPMNGGMAAISGNGAAQPPSTAPQPRPLSPFTMYEDLKPPTSQTPPPRKL